MTAVNLPSEKMGGVFVLLPSLFWAANKTIFKINKKNGKNKCDNYIGNNMFYFK